MRVERVGLREFRNYERAETVLGEGLTVVCGPNGAGKTNFLEAVYLGCTGRSCRTSNERELVRRGTQVARVELQAVEDNGTGHLLEVGLRPGEPKLMRLDGARVERLSGVKSRPLVCVFMPDRLELIKGAPALRRAHVDQLVAALWPARAATRVAYARALTQRNALLARIRSGSGASGSLGPWDAELAHYGAQLRADRVAALALVATAFGTHASDLGLPGSAELRYRPRSEAFGAPDIEAELERALAADIARGFTTRGPHRDELELSYDGLALRSFGSQGQQRLALLALLFAERDALVAERRCSPLLLLDDVMSELDGERRERLIELVEASGQAVITATEPEHVPGAHDAVAVAEGGIDSHRTGVPG
jgi:DNA replication and repair protein RecF